MAPEKVDPVRELMASVVVFLVALPLCIGIAEASGAPAALGLVTGIVGGLVVGFIAGQPLQVSGPAAGLLVLVLELIQEFGLPGMALAVLLAGALQLTAGFLRVGRWFRAVSPAVIQGMLSGIGVLIFASQFHVMVDDEVKGTGLEKLVSIPGAIYKAIDPSVGTRAHHLAALAGVVTIVGILGWQRFKPSALKAIPGALVGVVLGGVLAGLSGFEILFVEVPSNLLDELNWVSRADTATLLSTPKFMFAALGLAVIASAETLLCATAVDRMHDGPRTNYDKELRGQGIGNMICGVLGALPMTGVIVRSSANVEAGAKTKWSAVVHGFWLLVLVVTFPSLLELIPKAGLAAILVFTGIKLFNVGAVVKLAKTGRAELIIWLFTVGTIVAVDLLSGVVAGIVMAMLRLLWTVTNLEVQVEQRDNRYDVTLAGAATFVSLPTLAEALERIPRDGEIHVHIDTLSYVDHACFELLEDFRARHPGGVVVETDGLDKRRKGTMKLKVAD